MSEQEKPKTRNLKPVLVVALVFVAGLVIGQFLSGGNGDGPKAAAEAAEFWTCSMHPQIQKTGPGACPICGMDLIAVTEEQGDELGPMEIKLSPRAQKLAEVEVLPVERRFVTHEIRLVGKVTYDETRLANITARVPGRLDRLYVDYAGIKVKEGDHLVHLYSPELLAAQEELIQSLEAVTNLQDSSIALIRERAQSTVEASREKLRLWGLADKQIKQVEQSGQPSDHITINSPISGVVIEKNLLEGAYVQTGTRIYTIADLSHLWVKLDAYESDLTWLHYSQEVNFSTEAYPGEVFKGTIAFIDPMLNPKTRTVKVRVNVDNPDGRLKPDMFVRAAVKARIARGGKVFTQRLAGKWISPMHPEVVKDGPGSCDVCGMDLVPAESLGYVLGEPEEAPMVIPASAPLITGERAMVYVRDPSKKEVFAGREITLGPRAGDWYIVKDGLSEGDLVVHNGNFKIDSAMQILAKPSMMNPTLEEHQHAHHQESEVSEVDPDQVSKEFQVQLRAVYEAYLDLTDRLAGEQSKGAEEAAAELYARIDSVDMKEVQDESHMAWMKILKDFTKEKAAMLGSDKPKRLEAFNRFSKTLAHAVQAFGLGGSDPLYLHTCPMALEDRGAVWLQSDDKTRNPYFEGGMLRCGSVKDPIKQP